MSDRSRAILPAPVRRRRPSFVLTSLIDVIFLLVIFFMVSSQIVPYSLLPLGPLAADGGASTPAPVEATAPPVAVRILAGRIMIGGQNVPITEAETTFRDLKTRGVTALLLTPSTTATVQDIVTVLEASKAAEIGSVTVLGRRDATP